MRKFATSLALTATLAWSASAIAATVNVNTGSVSINGGKPVAGSAQVQVGDAVTAGPNGNATIVYGNNCTTVVEAGATVSVLPDERCVVGASGLGGFGGTGVLVGAGLVAGAIGIGVAVSQNSGKKKSPASP